MKHRILLGIFVVAFSVDLFAQSGTNSPYSQYGLGILTEQSQGFNRGMNGAGIGLRKGNIINTLNPASYSAVDSLTMLFDVAVSGQITNLNEGKTRVNQKTANVEYAVGSFRLLPHVGMAVGILPYTNVGYQYATTNNLGVTETYSGDGGLREVFVGAGWQMFPQLSVGVNVGYLWGSLNRSIMSSATSSIASLMRSYSASVSNYKIDAGLQWNQVLTKKDNITIGATVGIGHKLGADATYVMSNVTNGTSNTEIVENGYALPMTYGFGLAWSHDAKIIVDADFTIQKWGSMDYPGLNASGHYVLQNGLLMDSYHAKLGVDFVPDAMSRDKYLNRVHYRLGAGLATPYYKINDQNGPKELTVSAGFGLPVQNSFLNISAQWGHTAATNMITENTFRINIGLTFNERWFAKWKVE